MTDTVQLPEKLRMDLDQLANACPTTITSQAEFESGNQWLVACNARRKEVQAFFKGIIKPLKDSIAKIQAHEKEGLSTLTALEVNLRKETSRFWREDQERKRKEQEKINRAYDRKIQKKLDKGEDITAVAGPKIVEGAQKTAQTEQGKVTFAEVKKVKILDESQVPEKYWKRVLNTSLIEASALAGENIPGVKVVVEVETRVVQKK